MALVVEDGTGKSTADAYDSTANVDTYATNIGDTAWSLLTQALKDAAARRATRYIEAKWRMRWRGFKSSKTQALAWPRNSAQDEDGYYIDSSTVPAAVSQAFAEACILTGALTDLEPDVARLISRLKVDVIEVEYFPGVDPQSVRSKVWNKVKHLLESSGRVERYA